MPEPILNSIKQHFFNNKRLIVWSFILISFLWLLIAVKELTALLFTAYFLSLLLDPVVDRFEEWGIRRGLAIFTVLFLFFFSILAFVLVLVPTLVREYQHLSEVLPGYLETGFQELKPWIAKLTGSERELNLKDFLRHGKDLFSSLGADRIGEVLKQLGETMLKGYSFTLTVINLTLLPFFVYYITRDLDAIHKCVGSFMAKDWRNRCEEVGGEILVHLQAFFRGQLTVSATMALLYVIGLSIIGLPSAMVVGVVAGFLNIVPYLGVAIGLILAILLTLLTDPSWIAFAQVLSVFGCVQFLEGMVLTPRIVGESVGIHPLGVIVALLIGGQLFGLVGMVLAIPAAAGLRVLLRHLLAELETGKIVQGSR